MKTKDSSILSRRKLLKLGAGTTAAAVSGLYAPSVISSDPITLRYLGTAVSMGDEVQKKLFEDTGLKVKFIAVTTDEVTKRVLTQPNSFDLVDTEYFSLPKLVPSGNILGMDTNRIKEWGNVTSIFTQGVTPSGKKVGLQGTAPSKVMYLEGSTGKKFADDVTQYATLVPTIYNADTLGIRPDLIGRPITSWAELLNPEFKGKAATLNIPSIGIMDAAMVVEAMGEYTYPDKGNMTKAEIDLTMKIFTEAKKSGQFRAFWTDFNESVNLMASGEVVIQSMWSPAITAVKSQGKDCVYQPLKEGYRAWAAGFALPKTTKGKTADAVYDFVNWYLSGWVGAYLNRQGYYSAVLPTAKKYMSEDEWGFWMEGKAANSDILSPTGSKLASAGEKRDGGSYEDRMGGVACWNATMDENKYMVRKWNEMVAS
tara:strand:- start:252 stop:1529 length:1278 start_codon:yes stop_codon:yes gene_type:complete